MDDMKNKGRDNHSKPYRKISIEMHEKIKLLRSYGLTKTKIAEKFNCTRTNIARILNEAPNLPKKGSAHPRARLKEKEVKEIFELDNLGMKRKDIAKKFSVAPSTLTKILKRDAWKHVHTKENAS
jgi:DNA invertase Pin-like site-specific DNA recombinase